MNYQNLTDERKRQHLEARLTDAEERHFLHSTTLRLYLESPEDHPIDDAEIEKERALVAQLEQGAASLRLMLDELPAKEGEPKKATRKAEQP